tara:strand:- start:182 stop:295 length:114 start_codon:yes stop_codon:yes gene_type:complete
VVDPVVVELQVTEQVVLVVPEVIVHQDMVQVHYKGVL